MNKETKLIMVVMTARASTETITRTHCYWCGQKLRECGMCKGSGQFRGAKCKPCGGHGCLCPTHEGEWDE